MGEKLLLITNLEKKLEMITKWLRDSGLTVNESKTEVCVFHKNDPPTVEIRVCNSMVKSKKSINVLGVMFDSKLNWNHQISLTISKAKKALYALRLIKKFFNPNEMRTLLDTYFYSILYYNSCIWLVPGIGCEMKQKLLSISACALRSCALKNNDVISFEKVHEISKKCTPNQIMLYQSALQLYKTLNFEMPSFDKPTFESITVLHQMPLSSRQHLFLIFKQNNTKIGMNTTANKFYQLSGKITLNSLGYSFVHFKKLMKIQFLKYGKT